MATPDLPLRVASELARLAPGHRDVLCALSGGGDSVALLVALQEAGIEVVAAHLDHELRGEESARDAAFVAELTEALGVRLILERVDVAAVAERQGRNLEDAARRVRYEFLHRVADDEGCDLIAVAHTVEDHAETMLLQALRGSALPKGIAARRGMVVRPLLGTRREKLREFLRARSVTWREDATNEDASLARGWLRHRVMPLLEARFSGATARLADTATALGDVEQALDRQVEALLGSGDLDVLALAAAPAAVQRRGIARLLTRHRAPMSRALVERVRAAVAAAAEAAAGGDPVGPWRTSLGPGKSLVVGYGRVSVVSERGGTGPSAALLSEAGAVVEAVRVAGGTDPPSEAEARALLAAYGPLTLRRRRQGDRVRTPGGSRSLSRLLVDRKVLRELRDGLLVLAAGSEVVWVESLDLVPAGLGIDVGYMRMALEEAAAAAERGELPVGAVVVGADGSVQAADHNRTRELADPSAHAEVLALRTAAGSGDPRLTDATLYVTLEPCPMCWGAVLQTRLARVVYGAVNHREGALGGVMDLRHGAWKRRPAVVPGVLAAPAAELLSGFFSERRAEAG